MVTTTKNAMCPDNSAYVLTRSIFYYGSIENYIKSLLLSDGSTFNRTLTLKCHNETKIIFQTVSEKVSGFERKQNVIEVTQLDCSNHNHYDNHKQLALIAINTVLKKHFAEAK